MLRHRARLGLDVRAVAILTDPEVNEESAFLQLAASWGQDLSNAGRRIADLAADGHLHRGLRDVLAHHIVFS